MNAKHSKQPSRKRNPSPRQKRPVVMNLGVAPTIHENRHVVLEAHVIDEERVRTKPGETWSVELIRYLRPERKFPTIADLQRAIRNDVARARRIVGTRIVKIVNATE